MKKTVIMIAGLVFLWCAVWSNVCSAVVVKSHENDWIQDLVSDGYHQGLGLFDRNDTTKVRRAIEAIKTINRHVAQWVANNEVTGRHIDKITPITKDWIEEYGYYYLPPRHLVHQVAIGGLDIDNDLLEWVKHDFILALDAPLIDDDTNDDYAKKTKRSLHGTWSWSAKCKRTKDSVIIPFSGSFSVYKQYDKDGKWGTFGSSHPGNIFNATITPKKLAFDRVFDRNTRRQRWDGSLDGTVLKGTVTDSAHTKMGLSQTCEFTAEQIYTNFEEDEK